MRSLTERLEAAPTRDMLAAKDEQVQRCEAEAARLRLLLEQAKLVCS